jgi:hypothetical protein
VVTASLQRVQPLLVPVLVRLQLALVPVGAGVLTVLTWFDLGD